MATLTPNLTLTCSDCTTDSLAFTATDSLSIAGDVVLKRIQLDASEAEILTNQNLIPSTYNKVYVFIKNLDSSANVTLGFDDNDSTDDDTLEVKYIHLAPGEFAFFPWASDGGNLVADASAGTPIIELMIFEATA